ncbi:MAG: protein phosphatase CheZ [Gammaproteobacteria bacterium]|nr:MAG: protein phosphatase CheZ [Gammaproteobacteria bacterium]
MDAVLDRQQLLTRARALVQQMETGDMQQAEQLIDEISQLRESGLFQQVGKLTRELHESLNSFRFDERIAELAEQDIPDARQRLNYVISMTEQAAHRTLTSVEAALPLSDDLRDKAGALKDRWQRLLRRELDAQQFKVLSGEVADFLDLAEQNCAMTHQHLSDVLMAQDYQDITGQIIRRVISLVQGVEESLVKLVRISGQRMAPVRVNGAHKHELEGPQINSHARTDVAANQDDVDNLLSSLGF